MFLRFSNAVFSLFVSFSSLSFIALSSFKAVLYSCKEETKTIQNDFDEIAIELFEALGGKKNIISVDHCITRLHVEVKDISIIDKQALSKMNFSHIVEAGEHEIQIIVGTEVQFIAEILNEILM